MKISDCRAFSLFKTLPGCRVISHSETSLTALANLVNAIVCYYLNFSVLMNCSEFKDMARSVFSMDGARCLQVYF